MKYIIEKSYEEFIAPYTVYETYTEAEKYKPSEGYEIHHIVPKATQDGYVKGKKPKDDRCIILTIFNHILAHYLYCRDYPKEKSQFIALNSMCQQRAKELLADEKEFLKDLPYLAEMREKGREGVFTEERNKKISESLKGEKNPMYGRTHTAEARKRISETHKGLLTGEKHPNYGKQNSLETRKKISEALKGKTTWMKGKHHTEEAKQKISETHKGEKSSWWGRKHTEEEKRKIAESHRGKHHTEEAKQKMSEAKKGKYVGGNCPSAKKVFQRDLNGNIIQVFPTVKEAGIQLGKSVDTIRNYIHGKTPKNFPYIFSYN